MIKLSFSMLMRIAALMAACALVGCGGASSTVNPLTPTRIVAFGDGTNAVDSDGYGTFTVRTTETDNTVAGRIAAKYSTTKLTPISSAVSIGSTGNYSYATGIARAAGVATQVGYFFDGGNTVGPNDLFIISVGALDIYDAYASSASLTTATASILASVKRLTDAGAQYVLVVYPINMARTPWGNGRAAIQALSYDEGTSCASFSCKLTMLLNTNYYATTSHQTVLIADLMGYSNLFTGTAPSTGFNSVVTTIPGSGSLNTFASYGVANPSFPACGTAATTPATGVNITCSTGTTGTVLYSGSGGVVTGTNNGWTSAAWDYTTSVFADQFNLTPLGNRLLADRIYNFNFYSAGWR
jgi:hypothetical protein